MPNYHETIKREVCYSEIINKEHYDFYSTNKEKFEDAVLQLKDGSILIVLEIESSSANLLYEIKELRRDALCSFFSKLDSTYEIFYEWCKKEEDNNEYIDMSQGLRGSAKKIEEIRRDEYKRSINYKSRVFFTLLRRNIYKNNTLTNIILEEFFTTSEHAINALNNANCKTNILKNENLLSYLKFSQELNKTEIKMPNYNTADSISTCLLTEQYHLKNIPLIIEGVNNTKVQAFSITALPQSTNADMFSFLAYMPFEFRLCIKYKAYSFEKSNEIIAKKKKVFKNSIYNLSTFMKKEISGADIDDEYNHSSVHYKIQCEKALDEMIENSWSAGEMQINIILYDEDENQILKNAELLKRSASEQGLLLRKETLANTLVFLSCVIGSPRFFRKLLVLSQNFADTLHLSRESEGAKNSPVMIRRNCPNVPLIYARCLDSSIYYFSLFGKSSQKCHTFVTGPSGSGKSILLSLFASQYLKYKKTRVFIIDRDLSSLQTVVSNNGDVIFPGKKNTSFQPLYDAVNNKKRCISFLHSLLYCSSIKMCGKTDKLFLECFNLLDNKNETLSDLYALLKGRGASENILNAIYKYTQNGEYGSIFDGDEDIFSNLSQISLIETSAILKNDASLDIGISIPSLMYIFSILEEKFNESQPTLLIIDEAWKILKDNIFSSFIEEWMKTLRKKNVDIVFSITNLSDITDNEIAETILSNSETKIFFKDNLADSEIQYNNYLKAGLDDTKIRLVKNLPHFCPLVISDEDAAIVDFRIRSQLEYINTTDELKNKYL